MKDQPDPAIDNIGRIDLGHYELPDNTFEHDLSVLDRYQSFSAELLRLSLTGIAAVGFLITSTSLKAPLGKPALEYSLYSSLICFGLSAAFALLHRYFSTDSISYHLNALRRDIRQAAVVERGKKKPIRSDAERAEEEKSGRRRLFRLSEWLIYLSGALLWLGAIALIIFFIGIIKRTAAG
ncbi:MAG TPA: hypothetical protein VE732_08430 [Nitrososphaera sp.]|nr:hypothetical protein [Nitrososphaera sp.]